MSADGAGGRKGETDGTRLALQRPRLFDMGVRFMAVSSVWSKTYVHHVLGDSLLPCERYSDVVASPQRDRSGCQMYFKTPPVRSIERQGE